MRLSILILILLIALTSVAQDSTIYYLDEPFKSRTIVLLEDSKFVYFNRVCLLQSLNKGTYTKENKNVILTFDNHISNIKGAIINDSVIVKDKEYNYSISIIDAENSEPIDYAIIMGFSQGQISDGGHSIKSGKLTLHSTKPIDSISVRYNQYSSESVILKDSNYSYSVSFYLSPWTQEVNRNGSQLIFQLIEETTESAIIKFEWSKPTKYKKALRSDKN